MPSTLKITEGEPEAWPAVNPEDDAPISLTPDGTEPLTGFTRAAWQRVEQWISHRWSERSVVFVVEGPGHWVAPLGPFLPSLIERWDDGENDWTEVTLAPNALGGHVLDCVGPYRFTGTLGSDATPPEAVRQAVWRLAKYFEAADAMPAAERASIRQSVDLGGLRVEQERSTAWIAKALQQSGAADLLRPWRNLGAR